MLLCTGGLCVNEDRPCPFYLSLSFQLLFFLLFLLFRFIGMKVQGVFFDAGHEQIHFRHANMHEQIGFFRWNIALGLTLLQPFVRFGTRTVLQSFIVALLLRLLCLGCGW